MESSGNSKSGLLTAGGVLSIIGGVLEAIAGGLLMGLVGSGIVPMWWDVVLGPGPGGLVGGYCDPMWSVVIGVILLVLGVLGIAGGISALNRKSFGLSLAGAICILPTVLLGILAVIFVSVSKKEF